MKRNYYIKGFLTGSLLSMGATFFHHLDNGQKDWWGLGIAIVFLLLFIAEYYVYVVMDKDR